MIGLSLAVAAVTLAVGVILAAAATRLPTMRAQITALVLTAVVLPIAAVVAGGALMLSRHDTAVVTALAAAGCATLVGAWMIARRIIRPLDGVRTAIVRVAGGDLSARAPEHGSRETVELGRAFNHMTERLEELHDARTQLVAWVSHDLRTPLTSLQAMIEATQDGMVPAGHYLDAMDDQVQALRAMVDDLFELARLDAGALALELRATPVAPLVERCLAAVAAEAAGRHVQVTSGVATSLSAVRCAPEKVQRVLDNLVRNALRHTPSDGTVAVRVDQRDPDAVVISVEDTGEGLSDEALTRMFDHFWRGDPSRVRDGGGAGLGLAIARGLIEAQGGAIWAENRPGGGARVAFSLPSADAA